jgi:UDP-GlcNAc:undecaprenyl-phosphate/decaprenyl-phosphate GlcNAc-1-phosphate transferase
VRVVLSLAGGAAAGGAAWFALRGVLAHPLLARENHRGLTVPTAGGLVLVAAVLAVEGVRRVVDDRADVPALVAVLGFALLGLVDDLLGSGADGRGFRGHLRAMAQGRLTTGGLKLLGGLVLAVVFASHVVDVVLIAACANLANLFDRAPGRALKVSSLSGIALLVAAGAPDELAGVAVVVGASLALLPPDLTERLMIGDTGANAIGAVLGLGVVLVAPLGVRVAVVAVVVALNLLSEVVSFSRVIDATPPLRGIDRLGRRER